MVKWTGSHFTQKDKAAIILAIYKSENIQMSKISTEAHLTEVY